MVLLLHCASFMYQYIREDHIKILDIFSHNINIKTQFFSDLIIFCHQTLFLPLSQEVRTQVSKIELIFF